MVGRAGANSRSACSRAATANGTSSRPSHRTVAAGSRVVMGSRAGRKPSAIPDAMATRVTLAEGCRHMNRGTQDGRYLAFDR